MVRVLDVVRMVGHVAMDLLPPSMVDLSPYDGVAASMTLDRDPRHGSLS